MENIVKDIVNKNKDIFGDNPSINKIDVGFTNTIYSIDDKYIIKICSDTSNEEKFKKEISFYENNKDNELIPKLYYSSIDKTDIPYMYEIIEKVKGVTLYNVWHKLDESEREEIIKQLCDAMKKFHSNKSEEYDWNKKTKELFIELFDKAKEQDLFNEKEKKLLEYSYSKFDKYLDSDEFVLVHNDLHFDNIFYNDGKIKLIDFERSLYAPKDFELDILYRMIRKPWKFASEENEQYTNSSDYSSIMLYIEKYYPELVSNPYLYQRLAIYDMVYYLKQYINAPSILELKMDVINAAKKVALKDELKFEDIKTPRGLMDYMNINIKYGWIDKQGGKHLNNLKGFRENYRISSLEEVINTGLGTCIEQAKMMKEFFDRNGYENKLFCHRSYETEENFDKEVKMHCIMLFKDNDTWYHFEHSNASKRGIHRYNSVEEALENITRWHKEHGDIRKLTEIDSIPDGLSFKEFNQFVNKYDENKKVL